MLCVLFCPSNAAVIDGKLRHPSIAIDILAHLFLGANKPVR